MGVGFSVQIAQRAGANDIEGARNVVRTAVFTCISVGIVAGILLQMIAPFIPIWMGGAPEVIPLAQDYVRIYLMAVPFSILAMVFSPTMRSLGDMKTPMILNISGNLINCVLNFLFIYDTRTLSLFGHEFTMWGAGWGVSGAAFGTAVSNTFVGLFMFSAVMIRENPLKVPLHTCLHPQKNIILRMIGIGTPVAFERAIVASGQVVSTRLVTGLGTLPLAAHHLANTAESISYLPGEGIAYAATTLVGQSVGAGDIHKAQMYGKDLYQGRHCHCVVRRTGAVPVPQAADGHLLQRYGSDCAGSQRPDDRGLCPAHAGYIHCVLGFVPWRRRFQVGILYGCRLHVGHPHSAVLYPHRGDGIWG